MAVATERYAYGSVLYPKTLYHGNGTVRVVSNPEEHERARDQGYADDRQDAHAPIIMRVPHQEYPKVLYHDAGLTQTVRDAGEQKRLEAQGFSEQLPDGMKHDAEGKLRTFEDLEAQQHRTLFGEGVMVREVPVFSKKAAKK